MEGEDEGEEAAMVREGVVESELDAGEEEGRKRCGRVMGEERLKGCRRVTVERVTVRMC